MTTRVLFPVQAVVAILSLAVILAYLWASRSGVDPTGLVVGRDFVNVHLGGSLISAGRQDVLFDAGAYWDALRDRHGQNYSVHN